MIYKLLDTFELWWFTLKDNIFELGWRFLLGCNKWLALGGWHRACVVFGFGLLTYAFIITAVWLTDRRKK